MIDSMLKNGLVKFILLPGHVINLDSNYSIVEREFLGEVFRNV